MPPGISPRRLTGTHLLLSLTPTLLLALVPSMAQGATSPPGDGNLSARLAELAKPSIRSQPPARQATELSLAAEGPGSLLRDGNRVLVEVRFDRGAAAALDELRATGARILGVNPGLETVTVAARPDELRDLATVPRVTAATEVLTPFTSESTCPAGAVVSEGEKQLHAGEDPGEARNVFGVDGSGVTVGVLSDSFNQASEAADGSGSPIATRKSKDVAAGDLPGFANTCAGEQTPVEILDDSGSEGEDEGRAMAQIVHDLAPGAALAFATAFTGEAAFAAHIEELAKAPAEGGTGADVVVDDVAYQGEPFFQEGPIAVAVRHATEAGATYFSSAGNNSALDSSGHQIGSWEAAAYRSSGGCPAAVQASPALHPNACMDFNPGTQTDRTLGIKVAPGGTLTVDLQWNEPWEGVTTDLDAFLLDSNGGLIADSTERNVSGDQVPLEFFQWENLSASSRTVQLVVNRFSGAASPRLKVAFLENGSGDVEAIEYPRSSGPVVSGPATDVVGPTAFGHNGAGSAITVGAVPFNNSTVAEEYSSRGPVTHYFGPVEGTSPAAALTEPDELPKPEIAATDCGKTSFFSFRPKFEPTVWRFCGTSAAAPHAAAVAALMAEAKEKAPPFEPPTPAEIRAALLSSAVEVSGGDECDVGAGLVEAVSAIEDLLTPPPPFEPGCKAPLAEVTVDNAQAAGSWGVESPPAPPAPPSGETTQPPNPPAPETDAIPPSTLFHRRPHRLILTHTRTATATFELGSNEAGVSYFCQVDANATKKCPALFTRRYRIGPHVVRAWARDLTGNTDQSAAIFRFKVKRVG
jgi:Subtilase family